MTTPGERGFRATPAWRSFRPWRELAMISAIGMEMSWAVLWYRLFAISNQSVSYGRVFSILLVLLMFTYGVARLGYAIKLKVNILRGVLFVWLFASLLVGLRFILYSGQAMSIGELITRPIDEFSGSWEMIPMEFFIILVIILVWWRGIAFAQKRVGPMTVRGGFRTGVLLLFTYGLLVPFIGGMPVLALYVFIFFSLLAMTSARISIVRYLRGGQQIPFNRGWLIGIIAVILLMVSLSALAVAVVDGDVSIFIGDVFAIILYIITLILAPFIWLFLRIAFFVGNLFRLDALMDLLLNAMDDVKSVLQGIVESIGKLFGSISFTSLEGIFGFFAQLKPLALWGLILASIIIALLTLRSALGGEERGAHSTQRSMIETGDLLAGLRRLLSGNLQDLSSRLSALLGGRRTDRLLAAERIRQIYGEMMHLCGQLDHPRPVSRTPLEFLPKLMDLFPQRSEDLALITRAYLRVRYGDLPESRKEVDEVERAWQRVQSVGKDRINSHQNQ